MGTRWACAGAVATVLVFAAGVGASVCCVEVVLGVVVGKVKRIMMCVYFYYLMG